MILDGPNHRRTDGRLLCFISIDLGLIRKSEIITVCDLNQTYIHRIVILALVLRVELENAMRCTMQWQTISFHSALNATCS